jgi:hypothetical protein
MSCVICVNYLTVLAYRNLFALLSKLIIFGRVSYYEEGKEIFSLEQAIKPSGGVEV